MEPALAAGRLRRQLLVVSLALFVLFIAAAGGAPRRYYRIAFGAPPLALALVCLAAAGRLRGSSPRVRRMAIVPAFLAAAVVAAWIRPSLAGARLPPGWRVERAHALLTLPRDRARADLFAELQPAGLANCRLERFGDPHDGGYLLCGNLLGSVQSAYSYGIDGRDQWGCDVSRTAGVPLHQYDCFNPSRPACRAPRAVFHEQCIGPVRRMDSYGRLFDSLEHQFAENGDAARRVVVKMDVEGAEWETLQTTPDAVLERIDQLVVELHGIGLEHHVETVRRLKQVFHVAHVHFNNFTCAERIDPFPATAYEALFVNKRIASVTGAGAALPHPLDAPNDPERADCQAATSRWAHVLPAGARGR
jgi:hypothetical protein